jgi:polyphosphate kinase 2 (PPK2 family)
MRNPIKRWKLSPMDIESRRHWIDYSKAKDVMFAHTDTKKAPVHETLFGMVDAATMQSDRVGSVG